MAAQVQGRGGYWSKGTARQRVQMEMVDGKDEEGFPVVVIVLPLALFLAC